MRLCRLQQLLLACSLAASAGRSGAPERTDSPSAALRIARRDGAALLLGVDVSGADGASAASLRVFGRGGARAIQYPIHVGVNHFGFKAGHPITNRDARPAHVDTIVQYAMEPYEAPDFMLLCARRAAADGGGATFLVDLPAAIECMPDAHRARVDGLEFVQRITLPADYDALAGDSHTQRQHADEAEGWGGGSRAASTAAASARSHEHERLERFVLPNPSAPRHRPRRTILIIHTHIQDIYCTRPKK